MHICFYVLYLFQWLWQQWERDKEVLIILSMSLLIRVNLLEIFDKADQL